MKREEQLPIRVSEAEKELLEAAAALEMLPTGTWVRMLALKEATRLMQGGSNVDGKKGA